MDIDHLTSIRELESRHTNGLQIRLWWDQQTGGLWVSVLDTRSGEAFRIEVRDGQPPLDVFHHPFAYAEPLSTDTRPLESAMAV